MNHEPIRIRALLRTSIYPGRHPVNLDALLWHACSLKTGHAKAVHAEAALEKLNTLIDQANGVFRTSSMAFGVYTSKQTLIATQTTTVGIMRPDTDLQKHWMHPTGRKGKYSKLQVEGGPYKNRLNTAQTYFAPEVFWDAVGNGPAICELLNFYVLAIGRDANRGFGSVGFFTWEPRSQDTSWVTQDRQLARILPETVANDVLPDDMTRNTPKAEAEARPPYRQQRLVPCFLPIPIRREAVKPLSYV